MNAYKKQYPQYFSSPSSTPQANEAGTSHEHPQVINDDKSVHSNSYSNPLVIEDDASSEQQLGETRGMSGFNYSPYHGSAAQEEHIRALAAHRQYLDRMSYNGQAQFDPTASTPHGHKYINPFPRGQLRPSFVPGTNQVVPQPGQGQHLTSNEGSTHHEGHTGPNTRDPTTYTFFE
jgi:hypothetical protein